LNYGDPKIDRLPRLSQWEKLPVEDFRDQDITAQRRGATFGLGAGHKNSAESREEIRSRLRDESD
jgi:hypothetical protein